MHKRVERFADFVLDSLFILTIASVIAFGGAVIWSVALAVADVPPGLAKYAPTRDYDVRPFGLLSYDGRTKTARWVLERLDKHTVAGDRAGLSFHKDPEVPDEFAASPADYGDSGFDIGHMAPAADHGISQEELKSTFTIANAAPQAPALNRGIWLRLEEQLRTEASNIVTREVFVITGPAWLPDVHAKKAKWLRVGIIGGNSVFVPTHCIKAALIVHTDNSIELRAWKFTNDDQNEGVPDDHRISTDEAEAALGLDLWHGIKNEEALEAKK